MEIIELNSAEMTALWKRRTGYEAPRTDCIIDCGEGYDIDGMVLEHARSWYRKALRDTPSQSLPLIDISARLAPAASPSGAAVARLPQGCIRVVEVMAEGWERPALVVTDMNSAEAVAQSNPFARSGTSRPVAIVSGGCMSVYSPVAKLSNLTVWAVMEPVEGSFLLTRDMIASMPLYEPSQL